MNEPAYWSKEVAEALKISDSTLRKWAMMLERFGYEFIRGANNSRAFVERDIIALRRMKELIQNRGVTVRNAAQAVISSLEPTTGTGGVQEANDAQEPAISAELLKEVLERQERLEELNRQLIEKLEKQQRYINERLEKRDANLMEAMRQVQETQRLIAASKKEQEEQKKGFITHVLEYFKK
jgi:DNA-binding transcriptional MerR regulator